jgi:23S rRNA (cytosine1962-C5)-methyltransferase
VADYQIIDSGDFYKLEKLGDWVLLRPSPQAVWPKDKNIKEYNSVSARYERHQNGKGRWILNDSKTPESFILDRWGLSLELKRTGFGHLGVFFEHEVNWLRLEKHVEKNDRVLNLFAYTGVASLICAKKGAEVVHVDASKTSVSWARDNQKRSKLEESSIRWIVEDVRKFVKKEVRRERDYEWIVLDPPSFGRGTKNESWVIEEDLVELMQDLALLKSKNFKGILLSSHSPGYTALSLDHVLTTTGFNEPFSLKEEMTVPSDARALPSGFCAWRSKLEL